MLLKLFILLLVSNICNTLTDILEPGSLYFITNENKRLAIGTAIEGAIPVYGPNETIMSDSYVGSFFLADKNDLHKPLVAECIFDGTIVIYLKDDNNILYLKTCGQGSVLNSVFSNCIAELSIYEKHRKIIWFSGGTRSFYSWFWYSLNINTTSSSIEWYDKGRYRDHQSWTFEKIQNDNTYSITEVFKSSFVSVMVKHMNQTSSLAYPFGHVSRITRPRLFINQNISLELQLLIKDTGNQSSVITVNPSNENKTFLHIDESVDNQNFSSLNICFSDKQNATLIRLSHSEAYDQKFWFFTCKYGNFLLATDLHGILIFIRVEESKEIHLMSNIYFISLCKGYGDEYYIRFLDSNSNHIEMLHPNRSSLLVHHNGGRKYIASNDHGELFLTAFSNDSSIFVSHGNGKFSCSSKNKTHDIHWKMDGSSQLIAK